MAKKPKIEAPENKTLGLAMNRLASQIADEINAAIMPELDALSEHQEAWQGGKFAVMAKVSSTLTAEQLSNLPDPKSDTGQNPANYLVEKFRDGKSAGWGKVYFYDQLALDLPGVRAMGKRVDQLKRSLGDPAKVYTGDIGKDITDLSHDYRAAQIKQLEKRITNAKNNVSGAFELRHQLLRFGFPDGVSELKYVECKVIYALGKDGQPLDGEDGREFRVDPTQTPIVIQSTVKGREDIDKVYVSIGTFLKYNVDKAIEGNGTYAALMNTVKREKPDDEEGNQNDGNQSVPQRVNTADTFIARLVDQAEFVDKVWSEKTKATQETIVNQTHGAGSDDSFIAARQVYEFLKTIVGGPKDDIRWQAYINEDTEHPLHKNVA